MFDTDSKLVLYGLPTTIFVVFVGLVMILTKTFVSALSLLTILFFCLLVCFAILYLFFRKEHFFRFEWTNIVITLLLTPSLMLLFFLFNFVISSSTYHEVIAVKDNIYKPYGSNNVTFEIQNVPLKYNRAIVFSPEQVKFSADSFVLDINSGLFGYDVIRKAKFYKE